MFFLLLPVIYLTYFSFGLPDSMLGAAWPLMHLDIGAPLASAGVLSMVMTGATVISGFMSARLIKRFGRDMVTFVCVALTAAAMFAFAFVGNFWLLCIFWFLFGLGGGAADAAVNNFVAIHYKPAYITFMHSMWGLGAICGPLIMAHFMARANSWRSGFLASGILQAVIAAALLLSLPLWKKAEKRAAHDAAQREPQTQTTPQTPEVPHVLQAQQMQHDGTDDAHYEYGGGLGQSLATNAQTSGGLRQTLATDAQTSGGLRQTLATDTQTSGGAAPVQAEVKHPIFLKGALLSVCAFFLYCAVETSVGLWAGSYLVNVKLMPVDVAARTVALFFIGITAGRLLSGVVANFIKTNTLVRIGQFIVLCGVLTFLLALPQPVYRAGLVLIGFGLAPIYPALVHEIPQKFGVEHSQALMGISMATASLGSTTMAPLFGLFVGAGLLKLWPLYLVLLLAMHSMAVQLGKKYLKTKTV